MMPEVSEILIRHLTREWRSIQAGGRPWGFWIREYEPLASGAVEIEPWRVPTRVWFVDDWGAREESVWKWARFTATRTCDHSDLGKSLLAIGRTAFAPFCGGEELYSEALWGPLCGEGCRWVVSTDGCLTRPEILWRA